MAIVVGAIGVFAALGAWLLDRRRRVYVDQPTTPAAAVFAGHNQVVGRASAAEPLISHRTQTASVVWEYWQEEERTHTRTVTETDSNGRSSTRTETYEEWHEIERYGAKLPWVDVVDESGTVGVAVEGAKLVVRGFYRETFKRDDDRGFFAKLGDNRTGRYRETEEGIAIGDELFVAATAMLDPATSIPYLADGDDGPFLMSTKPESSHTGNLGFGVGLLLLVFAAAMVGANLLAFTDRDQVAAWLPGVLVAVVGLLVALWIVTHNRLRVVGQAARRAWSLIDVQLERRAALIPSLASVIGAHVEHERAVLEAVTAERASLPKASEVADASATATTQTATLRKILATIEATPALQTSEPFRQVQADLADTENRIAGARTFYNDSVVLMRDRSQSFPGLLVARFSPLPARELFLPEGFERTVPQI